MVLTDRLLLQEFEAEDWQAVHRWCSDPEVMRFMLAGGAWTEERSRAYVQQALVWAKEQPRQSYAFAIVLRAEDRLIGGCRLNVVSTEHREGHIGYGLDRHYWGQGYGTEAVRALLGFGFKELGLHRISTESVAANVASVRVMEKAGMRREGLSREKYWIEDRWWDVQHCAILEHEWREQQS